MLGLLGYAMRKPSAEVSGFYWSFSSSVRYAFLPFYIALIANFLEVNLFIISGLSWISSFVCKRKIKSEKQVWFRCWFLICIETHYNLWWSAVLSFNLTIFSTCSFPCFDAFLQRYPTILGVLCLFFTLFWHFMHKTFNQRNNILNGVLLLCRT